MDKLTGKIKQTVNKHIKKPYDRTPNAPGLSTASGAGQGTSAPAVASTISQPVSGQIAPPLPPATAPTLNPDPNNAAQPPLTSITPAAPGTGQVVAHAGWLGLEAFFKVIGKLSEPFGPLKQAVSGMSAAVGTYELAAQNREDFRKLKDELDTLFNDLAEYFDGDMPPPITPSIANLAQGIQRELTLIVQKPPRGGVRGYISAEVDADLLFEHYRILEGLFRRLTLNVDMDVMKVINELATDNRLKGLPNSLDAMYRAAKSDSPLVRRGECTPNTRVELLAELDEWARNGTSRKIYWLNGMAGTGKTTIAYSFCRKLEDSRRLAASFFCSRQLPGCHDVDQIVPTVSSQLSQFSLPFRAAVSQVLQSDSYAHNQLVPDQFRQLILEPLVKSKNALPTDLVVVVDALDECDGNKGADIFMALLSNAGDLPIKFFVTSRPDAKILDLMRVRRGGETSEELHLHDLDQSIVSGDIRTYLRTKLALSPSDLDTLVERSGVLFIYAATVIQYIGSDNFSRATKRLKGVLGSGKDGARSGADKLINGLYATILAAAFEDTDHAGLDESDQDEIKQILHTVVCAQEPLSIEIVARMLGLENETVEAALRPLRSVLQVSDMTGIITTLHESFPDYLLDKSRSGGFYCDANEQHARLTRICFNQINRPNPPFNICKFESSYVLDTEVPDLPARVEKAISRELRYACHYWGAHIMLARYSQDLAGMLLSFLSERFLFWLEVVNLCEYIYDDVRTLHRMQRWTMNCGWLDEETKQLLRDAWMFAVSFASSPARLCTPHIYVSVLMFWPDYSPMRKFYQQDSSKLIANGSTAMNLRSAIPLSVHHTSSAIRTMSYSPDGAYIATSSGDYAIHIWDAHTGQPVGQPLKGHSSFVNSVAYSADGAYIVSGSSDKTIRIWDAHTGQPLGQPLEGHTSYVWSVAYSPDGAYIVSGSKDKTIRIWDTQTSQPVGRPLEGHTGRINSIACSPDGTYIVSGSEDKTVCIWDARTGHPVGKPLKGHTNDVHSVAYSPDGAYIVSGSWDETIRIWNVRTGQPVGQPLKGHTGSVTSVAYSPDGAYIVSGSDDTTIRIWDAHTHQLVGQPLEGHTGEILFVAYSSDGAYIISAADNGAIHIWDAQSRHSVGQPLEGHTSVVTSVAYSPDGTRIVSGSWDKTIRIRDTRTCRPLGQPLEGHTRFVTSVAYSPDGAYIVSGSEDTTIRIWDTQTSQPLGKPLEGHTGVVWSVAYSPDNAYIVSGSWDNTIRIWDAQTGQPVRKPLEGHTGDVNSVAYSLDGAYIVSGSADNTIRIWDAQTGHPVGKPLKGHTMAVRCVAYSPDGAFIASGSWDAAVRIWDAQTGQPAGRLLKGHTNAVLSVAYSPDGAYIVSGSADNTIRIWDAFTHQQVGQPLEGHTDYVASVAYSPAGTYIASVSDDQTIRIWDLQSIIPTSPVRKSHNHTSQTTPPLRAPSGDTSTGRHVLCNLGCRIGCPHMAWTLTEDGWIVYNGDMLIWVPPDLRPTLVRPQNTAVIYRRCFLQLDIDPEIFGDRWSENFRPRMTIKA
ncbi:hypothetical protein FRC12_019623 [Ceratobasidium sp. 428]|nr:hypothetical protein FRC12_019623 [Ceratobasidium sp. 428]